MQYVYIIVLGLHVLAGVFWAGTPSLSPAIRRFGSNGFSGRK